MILHCVFCAIKADAAPRDIQQVWAQLSALQTCCDGMLSFDGGPNIDLEKMSQGFTHGFVCRFSDLQALEKYAVHPSHQAAGRALVALCEGGTDGIMVFDLAV